MRVCRRLGKKVEELLLCLFNNALFFIFPFIIRITTEERATALRDWRFRFCALCSEPSSKTSQPSNKTRRGRQNESDREENSILY